MKEYKSPIAALLWSVSMSGFGQYYNGQYLFGTLLFSVEIVVNVLSNLNTAILLSFNGDYLGAHDVFNAQWGLFYPSTYMFSIWQAYNRAIGMNYKQDGRDPPKQTYLTGFFFGSTIGMNLGVFWHAHFMDHCCAHILASPIFNGMLFGVLVGVVGHVIERYSHGKRDKFQNG
jgi:hypothetical protein